MKKKIVSFITLLLPSFLVCPLLRLLGHQIGTNVKIGFSIITCDDITLLDGSRIGHFNLIFNKSIRMEERAYVGYLNVLKGPFSLILKTKGAIGNKNYLTRAKKGITYGDSMLFVGELSKITVGHHLDLTRSIIIGEFSILAGIKSQIWTHGYYHADQGPERIRIDGDVHIGNNVYVGSSCIFNPGVKIGNAIHIGAGSVISKDLIEPGMYVGQALRYIKKDIKSVKRGLTKLDTKDCPDLVYNKNILND